MVLLVYSIGGTALSLRLGRSLVGLNFQQEACEADFRCQGCALLSASVAVLGKLPEAKQHTCISVQRMLVL